MMLEEKDLVKLVRENSVSEVASAVVDVIDPQIRLAALGEAARLGLLDCVQVLLDAGIDPTLKHAGRTALYWAVRVNSVDIIQVMLEHSSFGLDLGLNTRQTRKSQIKINTAARLAMFEAACHGEVESLEVFLKFGIDPNFFEYHDNDSVSWCTPLIASCYAFHGRKGPIEKFTRAASMLMQYGADVTKASCYGETALHYAVYNKMEDVVKTLLRNGADVNQRNGTGRVAMTCVPDDHSFNLLDILLDWGADINLGDKDGWTCLHFMCAQGHARLVRHLLQNKADPNIIGEKSVAPATALALAVQSENGHSLEIVKTLLEFNCDVNLLSYPRLIPDGSPFYMVCYYTFNAIMAEMIAIAGADRTVMKHSFQISLLYKDMKKSGLDNVAHWMAIHNHIYNPSSLRHQCRLTVRRILRGHRFFQREKLPLPKYLINYLTLPELEYVVQGVSQISEL